jgi:hypothetical protein
MQQLENRTWWLPTLFLVQLDDLAKSVKELVPCHVWIQAWCQLIVAWNNIQKSSIDKAKGGSSLINPGRFLVVCLLNSMDSIVQYQPLGRV